MLYFVAGIVLSAIGVIMLAKPQLVYRLVESWKHDGGAGEPSQLWLWSTRSGGVMFTLAGIAGLAVPFLATRV